MNNQDRNEPTELNTVPRQSTIQSDDIIYDVEVTETSDSSSSSQESTYTQYDTSDHTRSSYDSGGFKVYTKTYSSKTKTSPIRKFLYLVGGIIAGIFILTAGAFIAVIGLVIYLISKVFRMFTRS